MRRKPVLLGIAILLICISIGIAASNTAYAQTNFAELYETAFRDDIYCLDVLSGEGNIVSSDCQGDLLLFVRQVDYESDVSILTLFDVTTGKITASQKLPTESNVGFLPDGRIYTINNQTMETTILSTDLVSLAHFEGTVPYMYGCAFLDPNGETLWCVSYESGALVGFSMADGTALHYDGFEKSFFLIDFYGYSHGELFYLASDDGGSYDVYGFKTSSGAMTLYSALSGFTMLSDGLSYCIQGDTAYFSQLSAPSRLLQVNAWHKDEYPADALSSMLLTTCNLDKKLRLFDLNRSVLANELPNILPAGDSSYDTLLLSEKGFAVISIMDYETFRSAFYIWDYKAAPLDMGIEANETSIAAMQTQNKKLAKAIDKAYGIRVFYGEEGAGFIDNGYHGEIVDNDIMIHYALTKLKEFLGKYPGGMLKEMCAGPIKHINLYFCGTISQTSDEGIMSAAALAGVYEDTRFIAFNLNYLGDLSQHLAHEFMHVMEDRIHVVCNTRDIDMFNFWMQFVPKEMSESAYYYGYHDSDGNELSDTAFTGDDPLAEDQPDIVWYVDAYAKANPLEDRARIMEYLFISQDSLPACFDSFHIMEKAQFLCAMIRECFPSTQGEEALYWERLIETVPYSVYEDAVRDMEIIPVG